jgi:hypothetical protein
VSSSGKAKKQKNPVKVSIQGALKSMGQEGIKLLMNEAKEEPLERPDVKMADGAAAQIVDPKI